MAASCALAVAREGSQSSAAEILQDWTERFGDRAEFAGRDLHEVAENALRTLALRRFISSGQGCRDITLLDQPLLQQYANRIAHHLED